MWAEANISTGVTTSTSASDSLCHRRSPPQTALCDSPIHMGVWSSWHHTPALLRPPVSCVLLIVAQGLFLKYANARGTGAHGCVGTRQGLGFSVREGNIKSCWH